MSPEQIMGRELDHRSDLFSLGSLIYFIATGREPFTAENAYATMNRVTHAIHQPARQINADVPEVLNRIIDRLLEKDATDRIESASKLEQMLTELLAHLQEPSQHSLPKVGATRVEKRRSIARIGWWVGIAFVLLASWLYWTGFFNPLTVPENKDHSNTHQHDDGHGDGHDDGHGDGRDDGHGDGSSGHQDDGHQHEDHH